MSVRNAIVLVVALLSCASAKAAEPTGRLVHVSGQGIVQVAPDQVVIQVAVSTVDDDLIRVRENSDKDAQAILNAAKKYGAEEKGFHVSSLKLSLEFNDQLKRQIYTLERDVTVELNDLTKLDRLLLDLLHASNLAVKEITFTTSKSKQYEVEAIGRAVADAREKGQHLAELTGLKLGKARDIRVHSESQTPFVISVIPVVGSAQRKPPNRGTVRHQAQDPNPFGAGIKPPAGKGFFFVALEAPGQPGEKHEEGKPDGKPFAVGKMSVTAQVQLDYDLAE